MGDGTPMSESLFIYFTLATLHCQLSSPFIDGMPMSLWFMLGMHQPWIPPCCSWWISRGGESCGWLLSGSPVGVVSSPVCSLCLVYTTPCVHYSIISCGCGAHQWLYFCHSLAHPCPPTHAHVHTHTHTHTHTVTLLSWLLLLWSSGAAHTSCGCGLCLL